MEALRGIALGFKAGTVFQADSDTDNIFAMNGKNEISRVKPVGIFSAGNRHRRVRQRLFELTSNMTEALAEIKFKVIAEAVFVAISPYSLFS